jgi:hypothetical protein
VIERLEVDFALRIYIIEICWGTSAKIEKRFKECTFGLFLDGIRILVRHGVFLQKIHDLDFSYLILICLWMDLVKAIIN